MPASPAEHERRAWRPGLRPRWARASATRGDLCRDDTHAAADYVFREATFAGRVVDKLACGTCWPWEQNPGAKER